MIEFLETSVQRACNCCSFMERSQCDDLKYYMHKKIVTFLDEMSEISCCD